MVDDAVRSFEKRRDDLRKGTKELADSFERVRQFLLEYDAHDDRNGERWDVVRAEFDVTMRQGIETVMVLGHACESLLDQNAPLCGRTACPGDGPDWPPCPKPAGHNGLCAE